MKLPRVISYPSQSIRYHLKGGFWKWGQDGEMELEQSIPLYFRWLVASQAITSPS